jgi:hypothetical protein
MFYEKPNAIVTTDLIGRRAELKSSTEIGKWV